MTATEYFSFNMMGALAEQLDAALPTLTPDPLLPEYLADVDATSGVYQLFHLGELVYIGKADNNLCLRLTDHWRKISGRDNIRVADMSYTGLYLDKTWVPVGPEEMLIKLHEHRGQVRWNKGGFGNNDPGRYRDTSRVKPTHFDALYPASPTFRLAVEPATYYLPDLLRLVKTALPYVFRFENKSAGHPDYQDVEVEVIDELTADTAFALIGAALPSGWQLTFLPGYAILYKEHKSYPSAVRYYRSSRAL